MAKQNYTLGEVAKLGLLMTNKGTRVFDRSHVTKISKKMTLSTLKTPNGTAKIMTVEQIRAYNLKKSPLTVDPSLKPKEWY